MMKGRFRNMGIGRLVGLGWGGRLVTVWRPQPVLQTAQGKELLAVIDENVLQT